MSIVDIETCEPGASAEALRMEVREFLAEELKGVSPVKRAESWTGADVGFSRRMGERGWIGMTWPKKYGGHERSALERYVVLEEMVAAGAPVGAHWIADRQSGPLLMRYAPDTLALKILPGIARGETYFCIGMSEPNAGSDLASIRANAKPDGDGWRINGNKVWTTGAHRAHYMIAIVRTGERTDNRHAGMSQFLIDMTSPGVTVRPIRNMLGEEEFNEVFLEDVWVPNDCLIGNPGDGWAQVTAELALERSGPERYLSSTQLLVEMLTQADASDARHAVELGRMVASYATLRQMSLGVAGMLQRGENPALAATIVKDLGATVEQHIPVLAQDLFAAHALQGSDLSKVMAYVSQAAPSFSLRGGTREILRGIIARGVGLR